MGLGSAFGQVPWHEKLRRTLERRRGARLGESSVVSRQVHMSDPQTPNLVTILTGSDAGEVFYGRTRSGEIIHLDIFHEVGDADHHRVAEALRWALAGVELQTEPGCLLLDHFDLMTGTGGGRVTGNLSYGKKTSLRVAHRNHVHLAGRLPDCQLHLLVPMVSAVEAAVRAQGLEIRRVDRLAHARDSGSGAPLDLTNYTDENDTNLRGTGGGGEGGRSGSLRASRGGGGPAANMGAVTDGEPGTEAGPGAGQEAGASAASGWDTLEHERRLQTALDLSRRLGSPDEVKKVLDDLAKEQGWASLYASGNSQAPFIIRQLEDDGLVRRDIRGLRLTEAGRDLTRYFDVHLRDVKLRFRKLIRRIPSGGSSSPRRLGPGKAPPSPDTRCGSVRGAAPAEGGAWLGDVAVPETVGAALRRTYLDRAESPADKPAGPALRLQRGDVHVHLRCGENPLHICLLIDASASMAGRRILAAKHLARHLLVSTRDRIAVIAFQEREVRVHVPFTRDWNQVEGGLAKIQPLGLTPLAHGLTESLDLIKASRVRRPLLLLITDGIPTVPKWSIDPLSDALDAAKLICAGRIPFGCIGLQPSRRYLEELVRAGNGTLHVVEELDEDALVTIAHRERSRLAQKAR